MKESVRLLMPLRGLIILAPAWAQEDANFSGSTFNNPTSLASRSMFWDKGLPEARSQGGTHHLSRAGIVKSPRRE